MWGEGCVQVRLPAGMGRMGRMKRGGVGVGGMVCWL